MVLYTWESLMVVKFDLTGGRKEGSNGEMGLSYFFSAILREISSMSLGRRPARTLSTMLATSVATSAGVPLGAAAEASCTACSAPAATASAAVSDGTESGAANSWGCGSSPLLVSRT